MDPCIQKVIGAATRLDDALAVQQKYHGPVSMAVRMAHIDLRKALAGMVPEPQKPVPSGGLSAASVQNPESGVRKRRRTHATNPPDWYGPGMTITG